MTHRKNNFIEIEARFLDVDVPALTARLKAAGAEDLGEDLIKEVIFYDRDLKWQKEEKKYARVRKTKEGVLMTFKHNESDTASGTKEIDLRVDDFESGVVFLEHVGLIPFRRQEKKRHSFRLGDVRVDLDEWPSVPPYVELEGKTEGALKEAAERLGLDWSKAVFESARFLIEKYYRLPVSSFRFFTFEKIE